MPGLEKGYEVVLTVFIPEGLAKDQKDAEAHVLDAFDEAADIDWRWRVGEGE